MHCADLPVLAVVGATGTGKSDLAVALAQAVGGEVVNADSMQFYRGMDIGTAKLPPAERGGIRHHLLDVLDVTEEASVAVFQHSARRIFQEIRARGHVPVLVGGSGLYVRAALDVLEFPGTDPAVRARLEKELARNGPSPLRTRLREVDPEAEGRIHDDRRLIRALEVHELTGRPFSSYMPRRRYHQPALQIGLRGPRPQLAPRLDQRVERMVREGLEEEVRVLEGRGLRQGPTASRALGYAQFLQVLSGERTVAEAVEDTQAATRRFAKRQDTWFSADPRVHWLDFRHSPQEQLERALEIVASAGGAAG